jgi:hypothetical protein
VKRKLGKQFKLSISFVLLAFVLWNCKDDPNNTGMELLPGSDLKNVELSVEKESISAFTKKDVLIKTDEPNYNVFGTFNDPVFGKTSASMAFHARLPYYPDLADSLNLDSLVLYLLYKEFYGDTVTTQHLKVYELQEEVKIDTVGSSGAGDFPYYQDVDLKALAFPTPVGELAFVPKFELDSTETDTIIQELAIRLDQSLAEKLFLADSVDMVNNEVFLEFFKGLYVEAQDLSEGGALMRVSTLSGGSNLTLFYNYYDAEEDSTMRDSLIYRINSSSARISSYTHDYSTTDFVSRLEDETTQDSLIYLQTLGGLRAKVMVPSLDNWKDSLSTSNLVINKAQLVFHVDTVKSDYHKYEIPSRLILRAIDGTDPDGEGYFPSDIQVSESLYGGFYNSSDATYRFNITHHLQDIINDPEMENHGFYLSTAFQNEDTRRVVLKGATSHVGIGLEVTYTKLN